MHFDLFIGWGIPVGQNYAYGYDTWEETIEVWHEEVNDYKYGQPKEFYATIMITHYTQVINNVQSFQRNLHTCAYISAIYTLES